jgi:hypothetical protein
MRPIMPAGCAFAHRNEPGNAAAAEAAPATPANFKKVRRDNALMFHTLHHCFSDEKSV